MYKIYIFDFFFNFEIIILAPPGKLQNVSVHPSTVVATVRWHVENDGGYPITNFTLLYRPTHANASESWHLPQPVHVSPAVVSSSSTFDFT